MLYVAPAWSTIVSSPLPFAHSLATVANGDQLEGTTLLSKLAEWMASCSEQNPSVGSIDWPVVVTVITPAAAIRTGRPGPDISRHASSNPHIAPCLTRPVDETLAQAIWCPFLYGKFSDLAVMTQKRRKVCE